MKTQIRRNVFETNSSSVHSITMCTDEEYNRWIDGELIYDRGSEELVEITDEIRENIEENKREGYSPDYLTYEQYTDYDYIDYETYHETTRTPKGEKIHAFGYYGHD